MTLKATIRTGPSTKALDDLDAVRTKACDDMLALLTATEPGEKSLRGKSTEPVKVASFEC